MKNLFEQDEATRRHVFGSPAGFLAFGLGAGLFRLAPGTMGTLVAIPFAVVLKSLPAGAFWPALAALFLAGIYLCGFSSKKLRQSDPGGIVWDEMVGFWLSVAFLPMSWLWWLAAFVLFRCFDILKPWPIRQVEKGFGGGLGIMLDDTIAAVYTIAVLALFQGLV